MGRSIVAAIVGYFVFIMLVFFIFTGLYLAMGPERAFRPGVYQPTMVWLACMFMFSFVAAIVGGFVARRIDKVGKGPQALAVLIVVLGMVFAIPVMNAPTDPRPRPADVPNMQAMQSAQTPLWVMLMNPILSAGGALLGGKLRK